MTDGAKPALLVLASTYPRWTGDHEPGFVHELCKRLTERFDVTVVTSRSPRAAAREVMDGVEVIRYAYAPRALETLVYGGGIAANLRRSRWKIVLVPVFLLGCWLAARRLMKKRSIAVIHAHWLLPQGLVARSLSRRFRVPYCVTSHGGDLYGLRGSLSLRLKRKVAASSAAMTVVGSAMRDELQRQHLEPRVLEVIPMGVDLRTRFIPGGVPRLSDRLLFVGRLVPKKGLVHLLNALALLRRERPEVQLTIAGFGPERGRLIDQCKQLDLESAVEFIGAVPQRDLPNLLRRVSLFVAPFVRDNSGDQEGLGLVVAEAIGCECPVVIGNVAGVHELLGPAAPQLSVDASDHVALAQKILEQLRNSEAASAQIRELRKSLLQSIDWSVIGERYLEILQRCFEHVRVR